MTAAPYSPSCLTRVEKTLRALLGVSLFEIPRNP